jgi:hypothetical protein
MEMPQSLDSREQSLTPPQPTQHRNVFQATSSRNSTPLSKSGSVQSKLSSTLSRPSTAPKARKRTCQEAFADESKAEAEQAAATNSEKHSRKMAGHAQRMVELEIKKQRMDLEAKGKHLEAEERRIAAQHQREREKEQHDMQMLRLRLQYQGAMGRNVNVEQFSMEQFTDNTNNAFGDMGMGTGASGSYLT